MRDRSTNMWFYLHFRRKDIIALLDLGLSQAGGPGGPSFWQISKTYLNWGGHIMPTTILRAHPPDFHTLRQPWTPTT